MIILFLGAAFGLYQSVKSFVKRWIYFKKIIGNQPINNIFNMIKKQDGQQKGLQYYDNMVITGYPIESTQSVKSFFYMIYFKQTIIDDLEVQICVPYKVIQIFQNSYFSAHLYTQFTQEQYLLFGDFIYNSQSKVLRCKKIRSLFEMKDFDLNKVNKQLYFQNTIVMLLKIGLIAITLYFMFKIAKKKFKRDVQMNQVLISNYHQTQKCKICKNRNSDIIVLPCSHLICCQQCYGRRYFCPICRTYIQSIQKIFND